MYSFWVAVLVFLGAAALSAGLVVRKGSAGLVGVLGGTDTRHGGKEKDGPEAGGGKPSFLEALWGVPSVDLPLCRRYAVFWAFLGALLGSVAGVPGILAGVFSGVVLGPKFARSVRRSRWISEFRREYPRAVSALAACASVGSYVDGFKHVRKEFSGPVAEVFGMVAEAVEKNEAPHRAVKEAAREFGLPELEKLAEVLRIIAELGAGGRARELLQSAAEEVRFKERYRREVEANTAEIRMAALLANLVPVGLFVLLALNPESDQRYVLLHARGPLYVGLIAIAAGWIYVASVFRKAQDM